ncbi:MAG: FecR domain-containing protein, partial [Planctomycetota bacterium]
MDFSTKIAATSIASALLSLAAPSASGQDAAPSPDKPVTGADATGAAAAAKSLQAIIMDVQGKARWRPGPDAEWRDAKVNDLIDPGTEVRTGLRSRVTMRVGRNATVLVDSGTSFELPEVVMDGQTLRTTATVKSGRVDFKVDKVGFANDFKVVTPQTTLAVRGTGFSLA